MRRIPYRWATTVALAALPLAASAADPVELDELRRELRLLRQTHAQQIQALEQRIQELEQDPPVATPPVAATEASTTDNAFNPRISAILRGHFYDDGAAGEGDALLDEAAGFHAHGEAEHDHAHGLEEGFGLGETELAFTATVDPYFDAALYLAVTEDGDVEIEEAYGATRALPAGLRVKGGKFLSGIGYHNAKHRHQWDFADQNLAYRALLGEHGLADTGVQLTWLPDWPVYTRLGAEVLQGDQERFGAHYDGDAYDLDEDSGPRLFTAFAEVAPDLGYDHALQIGVFGAYAGQHQEIHAHDDETHALDGDAWLLGTDWVYRYDAPGAYGVGDLKVQAEYLYRRKDLAVAAADAPDELGEAVDFRQDGFYAQAVYGFAPRWEIAGRYGAVGFTNEAGEETPDRSDRWTLGLNFRPSEFSLLRLQFAHADIATEAGSESFNQWYLQYQLSLGSHGAHTF